MDRPISVEGDWRGVRRAVFVAAVEQAWADVTDGRPGWIEQHLQAIERRVFARGGETVAARAAAAEPEPPACRAVEQPMPALAAARERHRCKDSWASTGLCSPYWHCAPCHQGLPLTWMRSWEWGPGRSRRGSVGSLCRLGIQEAFAPAAEILYETLRVDVPEEAVRRSPEGIGRWPKRSSRPRSWPPKRLNPAPPADQPVQLVVAVDA